VGTTSAASMVTLANTGTASLDVTTLTAAAAPFARAGGSCSAVPPITIAAGANCTLTYTFAPSASGAANQTLTVTTAAPGSGTIALSGTGTPSANLSIVKTATDTLLASGVIQYTLTVANAGPSAVTGATVVDIFPDGISGAIWTCSGTGSGSCSANGSGNIDQLANLPVGATVVYSITANITLPLPVSTSNTATVAAPVGTADPNTANNSSTALTVIRLFANGFEDPIAPVAEKLRIAANGGSSSLLLPLQDVAALALNQEPMEVIRFQLLDSLVVLQTRRLGEFVQARTVQVNPDRSYSVGTWLVLDPASTLHFDWDGGSAGAPRSGLRVEQ